MNIDSPSVTSKDDRFQYLDALRGLAAIMVMTRHSTSFWNFEIPRSYLAVDLFFLLSGFVIGNAYDSKLSQRQLTVMQFLKIRLIRLYPLFLLSVAVSTIPFALNTVFASEPTLNASGLAATVLFTAFLLPSKFTRSTEMFAINGPYWSLFFELVTNFCYALIRPALLLRNHLLLVTASGLLMAVAATYSGSLNLGFSASLLSFAAGFVRATFGIFLGLLLYKLRKVRIAPVSWIQNPVVFIPICMAFFFVPHTVRLNGLIDALIVSVALPFIVHIAASAKATRFNNIMVMLGTVSYPIYVFHQPIAQIIEHVSMGEAKQYAPVSGIFLILILVVSALWIDKSFDVPIRRKLSRKYVRNVGAVLPEKGKSADMPFVVKQ